MMKPGDECDDFKQRMASSALEAVRDLSHLGVDRRTPYAQFSIAVALEHMRAAKRRLEKLREAKP